MPENPSHEEMDRMTADAIRRAKQMQMRSSLPQKETPKDTPIITPPKPDDKRDSTNNSFNLEKLLGGESDRLILIILILLLRSEKENLPIILALLYILM